MERSLVMVLGFSVSLAALGCDASEVVIDEINDAGTDVPLDGGGSDGSTDAPEDVIDPLPPLDAATCGNGNPGIGICASVADCPPEDACWKPACEVGPDGKMRCVMYAKDAGP